MVRVPNPTYGVCQICRGPMKRRSRRCVGCYRTERQLGQMFVRMILDARIRELTREFV